MAGAELDLNETEGRDRAFALETRGEHEEVRRDECLLRESVEQLYQELEDRLALGRVRAGAECVDNEHRSRRELLEERADADQLRAEPAFGLICLRLLDGRGVE